MQQATEWESLRTTLANRVRELESATQRSCENLGGEVRAVLTMCDPLPQIVDEQAKQVVTLFQRTNELQNHLGALRANHTQECSQVETHFKNLWSFVESFREKTEILEAQSAQWLSTSGVLQREVEQLLSRVQVLERSQPKELLAANLPSGERDMDLPGHLYRLQQDVNFGVQATLG